MKGNEIIAVLLKTLTIYFTSKPDCHSTTCDVLWATRTNQDLKQWHLLGIVKRTASTWTSKLQFSSMKIGHNKGQVCCLWPCNSFISAHIPLKSSNGCHVTIYAKLFVYVSFGHCTVSTHENKPPTRYHFLEPRAPKRAAEIGVFCLLKRANLGEVFRSGQAFQKKREGFDFKRRKKKKARAGGEGREEGKVVEPLFDFDDTKTLLLWFLIKLLSVSEMNLTPRQSFT